MIVREKLGEKICWSLASWDDIAKGTFIIEYTGLVGYEGENATHNTQTTGKIKEKSQNSIIKNNGE